MVRSSLWEGLAPFCYERPWNARVTCHGHTSCNLPFTTSVDTYQVFTFCIVARMLRYWFAQFQSEKKNGLEACLISRAGPTPTPRILSILLLGISGSHVAKQVALEIQRKRGAYGLACRLTVNVISNCSKYLP